MAKCLKSFALFAGVFFMLPTWLATCKSAPPEMPAAAPELAAEPESEIKEPEFTIMSITILQADLINTRLKLNLKIDNPNTFPITLSSFRYDLYGNGSFWAGGIEKALAAIPAQSSSQADFEFVMNFIGMNRRLLDDIIAMRQVNYRIEGDVQVETGMESKPVFTMEFNYSGTSAVNR